MKNVFMFKKPVVADVARIISMFKNHRDEEGEVDDLFIVLSDEHDERRDDEYKMIKSCIQENEGIPDDAFKDIRLHEESYVEDFLNIVGEIEDDADIFIDVSSCSQYATMLLMAVAANISFLKRNTYVKKIYCGESGKDFYGLIEMNDLVRTIFEARFDGPEGTLRRILTAASSTSGDSAD